MRRIAYPADCKINFKAQKILKLTRKINWFDATEFYQRNMTKYFFAFHDSRGHETIHVKP